MISRLLRSLAGGALFLALASPSLAAQTATAPQLVADDVDLSVIDRIEAEGLERSQVPELASYLTDVIGPRLTGSPGMTRANEWTAQMFREWGLSNVRIEPWGEFGRGWEVVSYSGRILTPFVQPLNAYPVAWTGSTPGKITGQALVVKADSVEDLASYEGKLAGAIVLVSNPPEVEPEWEPSDRRRSLEELLAPAEEAEQPRMDPAEREKRIAEWRKRRAVRMAIDSAMTAEGVAAMIVPSSRQYGILRGGGNSAGRDGSKPDPKPTVVVSIEQYNEMYRNLERGVPVELELDVRTRFFDDDLQGYNTLADLPGSDLADQYVMIGAHLDSWHYGTGATDNAAGSVVMMEAMRILKSLGLQPRRTIRIALWSGEEQGLLGSRAWVEANEDLHPQISAYLNVDNGTGRIRGIWTQSNPAVAPIFEQILWPFKDLGVVTVKNGNTGGTDHLAFDAAGIPGFNFIQDPIEYGIRTHHTRSDTYERLVLEDLEQAAVIVAWTAYHLAMRDEMMPRKAPPASTSE
jgi:carboxypeptidase Q